LNLDGIEISLLKEDLEIITDDVPGWEIASNGNITVALDLIINQSLKEEGIARDLVNKIQNHRKNIGLEVMDNIEIKIVANNDFKSAINNNLNYICSETLTTNLVHVSNIEGPDIIDDGDGFQFSIKKTNKLS
jgi:isoleucyl-tRNA synthetase